MTSVDKGVVDRKWGFHAKYWVNGPVYPVFPADIRSDTWDMCKTCGVYRDHHSASNDIG
jgi:hypothetical protein